MVEPKGKRISIRRFLAKTTPVEGLPPSYESNSIIPSRSSVASPILGGTRFKPPRIGGLGVWIADSFFPKNIFENARRDPLHIVRWICLGFILAIVFSGGWFRPAYSQVDIGNGQVAEAPVVIDGIELFKVRTINENFTATKRANSINQQLQAEVKRLARDEEQLQIPVVEVIENNNLISLRIKGNEQSLATVSEVDLVDPGYTLKRQGRDWAKAMEEAFRRTQQERAPTYVQRALLYSLGLFVGAIAIHLLLSFISSRSAPYLDRWLASPISPLALWERPIKFFWQLGLLLLKIGLWLATFFEITSLFPQLRSWRYKLGYSLVAENIVLGEQNYSALELLLLVGLTVGLWFAARFVAQLLRIYILKRAQVEPRLQDIISVVTQYVLLFLGVIVLLQAFGINASSLAILASVLGVGIGFGVQNIANNFISGFIITLERPIQVGDFIQIGDLVGIVKQVGARSTEINTLDKVTIIVPNSRFLESEVINWSHSDSVSRVRVPVGVAYGSDISQVKAALLEAVKRHPEVLLRPKPEVWFQSFGDSALNFEVMVWTGDPRKQFRVKSDLNYEIEASLRRHNIEIPFPQQDVYLRSPQLDEILTILKQQSIDISPPHDIPSIASLPVAEENPEQAVEQTTEQTTPLPDLLANLDEEALAEAMRGQEGVPLQALPDEPNGAQTYFSGAAVVSWLQKQRDYDHAGAMLVGKWLLQKGLIYALAENGDFEDGPALFQFYQDSPAALAKSFESPSNPVLAEDEKDDENDTEIYTFEAD